MKVVDALNLNISDHFNGYGMMDGELIPNCWTQYDMARSKLDEADYQSKKKFFLLSHGLCGMIPTTIMM